LIAKGLVDFLRERKALGKTLPVVIVRLRGTGSLEGNRRFIFFHRPIYDKKLTRISKTKLIFFFKAERVIREAAKNDLPNLRFFADVKEAAQAAVAAASYFRPDLE
jgi:hypothetical protein